MFPTLKNSLQMVQLLWYDLWRSLEIDYYIVHTGPYVHDFLFINDTSLGELKLKTDRHAYVCVTDNGCIYSKSGLPGMSASVQVK